MSRCFEIGLSLWVPEKRLFGGGESGEGCRYMAIFSYEVVIEMG